MIQKKKQEAKSKSVVEPKDNNIQKKILKRIKMGLGMGILRSSTKLNKKPDYSQAEPAKLL